jgi:hypothetical protein
MVDPECPWWAKLRRAESLIDEIRPLRGAQQSREWLGDCSGDAEEAVVYRIRVIEPISAQLRRLGRRRIRNLRSSLDQAYHLAVQHSGPLTEDAERMTKLPIRICGAQFDDWATSRTNRRSCAARRSSGSGVPDDSVGIAVRVRRAAEAISGRSMGGRRWQIAGG